MNGILKVLRGWAILGTILLSFSLEAGDSPNGSARTNGVALSDQDTKRTNALTILGRFGLQRVDLAGLNHALGEAGVKQSALWDNTFRMLPTVPHSGQGAVFLRGVGFFVQILVRDPKFNFFDISILQGFYDLGLDVMLGRMVETLDGLKNANDFRIYLQDRAIKSLVSEMDPTIKFFGERDNLIPSVQNQLKRSLGIAELFVQTEFLSGAPIARRVLQKLLTIMMQNLHVKLAFDPSLLWEIYQAKSMKVFETLEYWFDQMIQSVQEGQVSPGSLEPRELLYFAMNRSHPIGTLSVARQVEEDLASSRADFHQVTIEFVLNNPAEYPEILLRKLLQEHLDSFHDRHDHCSVESVKLDRASSMLRIRISLKQGALRKFLADYIELSGPLGLGFPGLVQLLPGHEREADGGTSPAILCQYALVP